MKKQIALGMMSGTSIDGSVSVAVVETDGDGFIRRMCADEYTYEASGGLRSIHHLTKAAELAFRESKGDYTIAAKVYPDKLKSYVAATFSIQGEALDAKLKELCNDFGSLDDSTVSLHEIIERSTEVHIEAAKQVLKRSALSDKQIDIIGYHGQTLYHDPFFNRVTVQVGNAQRMADTLRVPVVFDFRQNDIHRGGQGAPLAPVYHRALLRSAGMCDAAILNLGGTANLTIVSSTTDAMIGFDTGPANGLIDRFVKERIGGALDRDSQYASRGQVSESALQALTERAIVLKDGRNYLDIQPPKSLDIRDYTFDLPEFQSLSLEDGCATLNAFTAECIARSLSWVISAGFSVPQDWILCGGGVMNSHLSSQLQERISLRAGQTIRIVPADQVGWSAHGMEAELFAYLAVRSLHNLPLTFPGTTGVDQPTTGGRVFNPQRFDR